MSFPSISITGNHCALNCDHCGGKILKTGLPEDIVEDLTPKEKTKMLKKE